MLIYVPVEISFEDRINKFFDITKVIYYYWIFLVIDVLLNFNRTQFYEGSELYNQISRKKNNNKLFN